MAQWWVVSSIPGVDAMHLWVEFVVGPRPCSERFSPDTLVSLPGNSGRGATLWMCDTELPIDLFIIYLDGGQLMTRITETCLKTGRNNGANTVIAN